MTVYKHLWQGNDVRKASVYNSSRQSGYPERFVMVSATQHQILSFDTFELNATAEEFHKAGTIVKLPPQPLRLLILLVSHAGQLVTREEIQEKFWGQETEIDFERRMNQCIKQIRNALGDDANEPTFIETIRTQGYRFMMPVESKTVDVPPPQVREASSSLLNSKVVRERIAALAGRSQQAPAIPATPPADAQPPAPATGRKLPMRYVAIAVALIAMVAGILYWYWQQ